MTKQPRTRARLGTALCALALAAGAGIPAATADSDSGARYAPLNILRPVPPAEIGRVLPPTGQPADAAPVAPASPSAAAPAQSPAGRPGQPDPRFIAVPDGSASPAPVPGATIVQAPLPAHTGVPGPARALPVIDDEDAGAPERPLPAIVPPDMTVRGDMIGSLQEYRTRYEDTLEDVARKFDTGFVEVAIANPEVDIWIPGDGTRILIPTAHLLPPVKRDGIIINLAAQRLFYFPGKGKPVSTHPIGVGREGLATPLGRTTVVNKHVDPVWRPTAETRKDKPELPAVVPAGPDNPLGAFALRLGWPTYLIHGTNKPAGVGRRVSRGCIRMYPEDIAGIFGKVPVGTAVTVVNEPVLVGRVDEEIYVEVHPTLDEADVFEEEGGYLTELNPDVEEKVRKFAGDAADRVDWELVRELAQKRNGVPTKVTLPRMTEARSS